VRVKDFIRPSEKKVILLHALVKARGQKPCFFLLALPPGKEPARPNDLANRAWILLFYSPPVNKKNNFFDFFSHRTQLADLTPAFQVVSLFRQV